MITLHNNQRANFKFVFKSSSNIYNPLTLTTPQEIIVNVYRGDGTSGAVIAGPFSSIYQDSAVNVDSYISSNVYDEIIFSFVPNGALFEGVYTVQATVLDPDGVFLRAYSSFKLIKEPTKLSPVSITNNSSTVVNYQPEYKQLQTTNHDTILLIGHANGIGINEPFRVRSIQNAIDTLNADFNSPLLRGILNAYAAGATDVVACAAAPMIEYVEDFNYRLQSGNVYEYTGSSSSKTFYEKYYERLTDTYEAIKELDFIDIVIPLQASILRTGSYDFINQLATHCYDFHSNTGFVQMGIIGSRSAGLSSSDITEMESNTTISNKLTVYNGDRVASDIGRFVIPVYGECLYSHPQLRYTYIDSVAASYAGMLTQANLGVSLIRKRVPGAISVYGGELSHADYQKLEAIGINAVYRGKKSKRNIDFEVYVSNDYTLARDGNVLQKAQQMRLMARLINEIKGYATQAIGKFSYDLANERVNALLQGLVAGGAINDYAFNIRQDDLKVGHLIFDIEVLSAMGLKKIDFSLSAGPGA